jgi:superfamily I DNA/RNA helicase
MYVGITRAQRSLHISYCERRKQARELIPCEPSRFIAEMGKEDVRFLRRQGCRTAWTRRPAAPASMP